jgi:alkaline phosphatase D
MTVLTRNGALLTRRRFLATAASSAAMMATGSIAKPYLNRAGGRPVITHGVQSGDISINSGVVWARADRPARMLVEVSTTDSFKAIRSTVFVDAMPESDFTAKALLEGLPAGQDIFYRISFQDHSTPAIVGEPQVGHFRTAPSDQRSVSFLWSGDTAGQGWGIDETRGGMRSYATMLNSRPDSSSIRAAASTPTVQSPQTLPNGQIWKNVVTEEKSKGGRNALPSSAAYKYNLLDGKNVRAFNAEVPTFAQWDDHEVTNDWCPGEPIWDGYSEKSILKLVARGNRAFREYMPMRETQAEAGRIYRKISYGPLLDVFLLDMRSYRTANSDGDEALIFGPTQLAWLKRELMNSQATWKVIAADLPIGLISSMPSRSAMVPRTAASTRSPIFSPSSSMPACAIRSG